MKIKRIISIAAFALTLSVFSLQPVITVAASNQVYTVEQDGNKATPRSDIKTWIYKIENGKKYKRLYNASTDTWETDWIYIGDV